MPYTASWDENLPAGSEDANTADNAIRLLKRDIRERMETLLNTAGGGTAFSADPIARKDTSKILRLHAVSGNSMFGAYQITLGLISPQAISSQLEWVVPLILPPGVSLTALAGFINKDAGASASLTLYRINASGVQSSIGSGTSGVTGWQSVSISGMPHTISTDHSYYVYFILNSNGTAPQSVGVVSVEATYNTTDSLAQAL